MGVLSQIIEREINARKVRIACNTSFEIRPIYAYLKPVFYNHCM